VIVQRPIIRRRHDLFAAAGGSQAALRHQSAPREQLVWRDAMSASPSPSCPARTSTRPCEPSRMLSKAGGAERT
jgi:hypothetical protein